MDYQYVFIWDDQQALKGPTIFSPVCCSKPMSSVEHKRRFLKNAGNLRVDKPLTSIVFFFHTMEVNGYRSLFDYQ